MGEIYIEDPTNEVSLILFLKILLDYISNDSINSGMLNKLYRRIGLRRIA